LLANVDGLDADRPDIPHHAIDIIDYDTVGAHKLSLVRNAFASPGPGAAGTEEAKRNVFPCMVERGTTVAPGLTPELPFHSKVFDLNGALGSLHQHCRLHDAPRSEEND
jgi:hypothetical protein